jgi:Tol biopolymer transport system component
VFSNRLRSAVVCLLVAGSCCLIASARAAEPKSIAVMDFELINDMKEYDSPEATAEQNHRLQMVGDAMRKEFQERHLYRVVDNGKAEAMIAGIKATYPMQDCKGCEREIGKALGADRVLFGWVQKVSNLILNLNIEVKDAATGEMLYNKSVDLRGNTDLSWQRGVHYMVDSIAEKKQYLK